VSTLIPAFIVAVSATSAETSETLALVDATRAAMEHNPELAEAASAVRAAEQGIRSAAALPEPMLSYQAWQQPLSRPVDPTATNMHMIGIRQSLPFPGQRGIAERAARFESEARRDDLRARRLAVQAQVAHAYVAWWRAREELRVHLEHMTLAERTRAAVEARYTTGGARQGDILRAQTDLHRLHADVAGIQESLRSSQALLAATMGVPDEALPPPSGPDVAESLRASEPLVASATGAASEAVSSPSRPEAPLQHEGGERPEVAAARARAERAATAAQLANRARRAPDLMIGFDYMLMPNFPDAYSIMLQVGVPWFSARRASEAERAAAEAQQARDAVAVVTNAARYERVEAQARVQAAKAQLAVLEDDVVPRADRTLQALRASYASGDADLVALIDAESALLDARLSAVRQHAALADGAADLRRALGTDLLEEVKR
jgi:outer membrane protein, heavy metal efflux system